MEGNLSHAGRRPAEAVPQPFLGAARQLQGHLGQFWPDAEDLELLGIPQVPFALCLPRSNGIGNRICTELNLNSLVLRPDTADIGVIQSLTKAEQPCP